MSASFLTVVLASLTLDILLAESLGITSFNEEKFILSSLSKGTACLTLTILTSGRGVGVVFSDS